MQQAVLRVVLREPARQHGSEEVMTEPPLSLISVVEEIPFSFCFYNIYSLKKTKKPKVHPPTHVPEEPQLESENSSAWIPRQPRGEPCLALAEE